MSGATRLPFDLLAAARKKLTFAFDGANHSLDAGLLLLRNAEQRPASSRGWRRHGPTGAIRRGCVTSSATSSGNAYSASVAPSTKTRVAMIWRAALPKNISHLTKRHALLLKTHASTKSVEAEVIIKGLFIWG